MRRRKTPASVRRSVYRQYLGRCAYCGRSLRRGFHVDHRWPLSKGGTNRRGNLQPLCARCNLRKGDRIPWLRLAARWGFQVGMVILLLAYLSA